MPLQNIEKLFVLYVPVLRRYFQFQLYYIIFYHLSQSHNYGIFLLIPWGEKKKKENKIIIL